MVANLSMDIFRGQIRRQAFTDIMAGSMDLEIHCDRTWAKYPLPAAPDQRFRCRVRLGFAPGVRAAPKTGAPIADIVGPCRSAGRKRKRASNDNDLCEPCRGGLGREREIKKKPAAAALGPEPEEPRQEEPPLQQRQVAAFERIAAALERLSAQAAVSTPSTGEVAASSSAGPSAQGAASAPGFAGAVVLPSSGMSVGVPLQALLASAVAAGAGGTADDILTGLGYGKGTKARGFAFAALDAVLAVVEPQRHTKGLFYGVRSHDVARARQFVEEHNSLCFIKLWSDVSLSTVVHSVSRALREKPELRVKHGVRFLAEVEQLLRQHV